MNGGEIIYQVQMVLLQGSDIIIAPRGENKNPSKPDQRPWEEYFFQEIKAIEYITS